MVVLGQVDFDTDSRVRSHLDNLSRNGKSVKTCFLLERDSDLINKNSDFSIFYRKGNRLLNRIKYTLTISKLLLSDKEVYIHDEKVLLEIFIVLLIRRGLTITYDDHELKNVERGGFKAFLFFRLEKYFYDIAEEVFVATEQRKRLASIIYARRDIRVRENQVYLPIYSEDFQPSRSELKILENDFVVVHQGRLLESRGKRELESCIIANTNVIWLLLGPGTNEFDKYSNVRNMGLVSNEKILGYWKLANAAFVFYDMSTLNNRYCAPNRLYMAIHFNLLIICNNNPGMLFIANNCNTVNCSGWQYE